jgi:hypothetical protein
MVVSWVVDLATKLAGSTANCSALVKDALKDD